MKARVFEVILHKLPSGKSPASALEEQLNGFLAQHPHLQVVATHMNTLSPRGTERHAQFGRIHYHHFLYDVLHRIKMPRARREMRHHAAWQ